MRISVARNFKGGLNTYDSQLGLSAQYLVEAANMYPDANGVLRVRYGTTQFADMTTNVTNAVGCTYYNGRIVVVDASGRIVVINGAGVVTLVWSTAIAALLPGAPAGWSSGLTFASFAQFRGELVICNGVDKPLLMTSAFAVRYLQDLGTGSNINTPRAKYCATHNNYLILAVTPTDKTTLYISNKGTSGTFFGDPAPNDAVNFQTATYITEGPLQIKGLFTFRDRLMVMYRGATLACLLGRYNDDTTPLHVPVIDDTIESHGGVGHHTAVVLGDDALIMDTVGVSSLQRALITNSISPQRETLLISRNIQQALSAFSEAALEDEAFAVHDRLSQHVMFFIPAVGSGNNTVFTYCYDRSSRFKAWTTFTGMHYQCGCRSEEGRVFLVDGNKVYYYRNASEPVFQDYAVPGNQPFSDGTLFDDGTGWIEATNFNGTAIAYSIRTVMSDLRVAGSIKHSQYLEVMAEGESAYTVSMYLDRNTQTPALTAQFNNTLEPTRSTPLALRPTNNMFLYAWPARFRYAQYRVNGETIADFRIIGFKLHHNIGGHI
jgi:hypothetical protein